jgi:hypothetical protein
LEQVEQVAQDKQLRIQVELLVQQAVFHLLVLLQTLLVVAVEEGLALMVTAVAVAVVAQAAVAVAQVAILLAVLVQEQQAEQVVVEMLAHQSMAELQQILILMHSKLVVMVLLLMLQLAHLFYLPLQAAAVVVVEQTHQQHVPQEVLVE